MPTTDRIHARRWVILGVLNLSLLLIVMDNTIVNVALPTIAGDLDASNSQLQWIVDSYVLVFAGLLLTAGALGDRFGRKGALQIGLVLVAVGGGVAALATSSAQLIATRALMGVGGAFIMPATLSILTTAFREPRERAKAIAIWSATAGVAVALGPLTGGWLLDHFWWGSVFLINVPVVAIALLAGHLLIPTSKDSASPPLDVGGALLSIGGLVSLVWAIIHAGETGWTNSTTLAGFAGSAALLVGFAAWEGRVEHPMLPISLFRNRRFSAASSAIMVTFFALFGGMFLFTQYLQFVLGYTAMEAGVRLLPLAGTLLIVTPNSARLVERFGTKAAVGAGLAIGALSMVLMSNLDAGSSYAAVALAMVVLGAGLGLVMAPATEAIMGSVPPAKAGIGSAVNDTTRELGGALGVAVLGSVVAAIYASQMRDALGALSVAGDGAATHSLAGALAVAQQLPGSDGSRLMEIASTSFVDAMAVALRIGAVVLAAGSALVLGFLPARASEAAEDEAPDERVDATADVVAVAP